MSLIARDDGEWTWFIRRPFYKRDQQAMTGKHMFYSLDRTKLVAIAEIELLEHNFQLAKIPNKEDVGNDFVLILYDKDNTRGQELARRHGTTEGIDYRGWKPNEDTRAGVYSERYLGRVQRS